MMTQGELGKKVLEKDVYTSHFTTVLESLHISSRLMQQKSVDSGFWMSVIKSVQLSLGSSMSTICKDAVASFPRLPISER